MNAIVAARRMANQRLSRSSLRRPEDVVTWMGAVQAQEYPVAKWGLGLRMSGRPTDAAIESAFNDGRILRTHVLRPTWHFVTPADIRWMLQLSAARVQRALSSPFRHNELDAALGARATAVFERALGDGQFLTRRELGAALARARLPITGLRLALLTVYAELEGVICSGPQRGKQLTYALLSARAPRAARVPRDEALGELAVRYFRSHGPATMRDFAWWSGLTMADARRGTEICRARPEEIDGLTYWSVGRAGTIGRPPEATYLLPVFDEYLVSYRDLAAVPRTSGAHAPLPQAVIAAGQVVGTWKAGAGSDGLVVTVTSTRRVSAGERQALDDAAQRYGRFMGAPATVALG